ncbi:MAG: elongation factor P [candidate division Zixibacteria bacterium]|nr:elongation factor P [candidate division Zixibacteria bacterium]
MADTTAIKKDVFIRFQGGVCIVTDFQHVNPGKGSAFVKTKLKNVSTGKVVENTFKVGEKVDVVTPDRAMMQYLYKDGSGYNFMDNESFEQVSISTDTLGDKKDYLTEGQEVIVLSLEGNALSVDIPKKLTFEVIEAMPAVKGDTASGNVRKEVTLETGVKLQVPLFINQGDRVVVNTETGEYVERA